MRIGTVKNAVPILFYRREALIVKNNYDIIIRNNLKRCLI